MNILEDGPGKKVEDRYVCMHKVDKWLVLSMRVDE